MFKKIIISSILLLFLSLGTSEAQKDIVNQIKTLRDSSFRENIKGNYSSAIDILNNAVKLSNQISDSDLKANCLYESANIYLQLKQKHFAFQYYLRSASLYKKTHNDSMISLIYYKIALIYFSEQAYKRSIEYFHLSERIYINAYERYPDNFKLNEYLGDAFYRLDLSDSAQIYYKKIYTFSEDNGDTSGIIISTDKLIQILKRQKKFKEAILQSENLFKIYKIKEDHNGMAVTKNNIGYMYVILGENDRALFSFKDAETESKKSTLGNKFHATTLTNIGVCLQNKGEIDASVTSFLKAREICETNFNHRDRAFINNLLAIVYFQKNDLYNASEYSLESIDDAKRADDKEILKNCYKTYSTILQSLDDYQKAMDFFKKHLEIRDSLLVEKRMNEQLITQNRNELERSEKDIQVKIADEEVKDMLFKQMKLEAEKREQELELLNKEKELARSEKEMAVQNLMLERQKRDALIKEQQIKSLEYDKEVQDMVLKQKEIKEREKQKEIQLLEIQNEKKELTIEKQDEIEKRLTWTFIFVLFILLLIVYNLVSTRKKNVKLRTQKKRIEQSNDELNQQNEEISAQKEYLELANQQISIQNVEITDSIKYAERIQNAVLPPIDLKAAGLEDYFIYYKPKDIVSGDFYWMKQIGENIVIAIADCTGHGVPGAFMSLLGISYLNEIVTKTRFDDAGKTLDRLRVKVKKSLGQTGKEFEQKDGMDIVFIIIDIENMKLQYAGANNPLFLISDNKSLLIKADRMPIGIHHKEIDFTNHEFDIKKGDVIYAFTDGFQDQFGGENGKKFLSKRFRNLLFEIHEKKMGEQLKILDETLKEWQMHKDSDGNVFPQIDDILVMGIRI